MSNKRQTRLTLADEPHLIVRSTRGAAAADGAVKPHAHAWGQLLYVVTGAVSLVAEDGAWMAPAGESVWAAPGRTHALRFAVPTRYVTLYLRPDVPETAVEGASRAVATSPLLRALIERATAAGALDGRRPEDRAAALLIAREIEAGGAEALSLPLPRSAALQRVAEIVALAGRDAEPAPSSRPTSSAAIAGGAGLGLRTLERRFHAETGMTFGRWRARARMQRALELLADGAGVKATASALGYRSASAFVVAFRASFGQTPGRYAAEARTGRVAPRGLDVR